MAHYTHRACTGGPCVIPAIQLQLQGTSGIMLFVFEQDRAQAVETGRKLKQTAGLFARFPGKLSLPSWAQAIPDKLMTQHLVASGCPVQCPVLRIFAMVGFRVRFTPRTGWFFATILLVPDLAGGFANASHAMQLTTDVPCS